MSWNQGTFSTMARKLKHVIHLIETAYHSLSNFWMNTYLNEMCKNRFKTCLQKQKIKLFDLWGLRTPPWILCWLVAKETYSLRNLNQCGLWVIWERFLPSRFPVAMLICDLGTVGLIFGWFNELENSHFLIWKNERKFPFSYLELIRDRDLKETMESMWQRGKKKSNRSQKKKQRHLIWMRRV